MHIHFITSEFFTTGLFIWPLFLFLCLRASIFSLILHLYVQTSLKPFPLDFPSKSDPLACWLYYTTGSSNWIENSVELVTGNIVLILQLLGHIFLLMVPMTEKCNWLFTTVTALAPLSWNNIQMNYCRQCKNKSELSCWSNEVPLWSPSQTLYTFNRK